jgi:hypothetical protein
MIEEVFEDDESANKKDRNNKIHKWRIILFKMIIRKKIKTILCKKIESMTL